MDQSAFIRGLLDDQEDPQLAQYDPQGGWNTAKYLAGRAAAFTGPGGVADAFGYLGEPSVAELARRGDYTGAGLTALGAVPVLGLLGKAGLGAKLAMASVPMAGKGIRSAKNLSRAEIAAEKKAKIAAAIEKSRTEAAASDGGIVASVEAAPEAVNKASKRNQKKGAVADVFADVSDYDEAKRLANRGAHLKQDKTGAYIGAPADVNSPARLGQMRGNVDNKVEAGAFNADWYDRARDIYSQASGYDPATMGYGHNSGPEGAMASLFSRGGAAYSPQAAPSYETNGFLRQHNNKVVLGRDVRPKTQAQADRVAAGYEENPYTGGFDFYPERVSLGKKTGPYADAKDPTIPDESLYKTANDIWHGRVFGYTNTDGTHFDRAFTPQEHGFLTGENVLASERATNKHVPIGIGHNSSPSSQWTPRRMQAATWGAEREAQAFADQNYALNKYDRDLVAWQNAPKDARGPRPTAPVVKTPEEIRNYAKYGIDDSFANHPANATYEYVTGENTGHLKGLLGADEPIRQEYTDRLADLYGSRDPYYEMLQMYQLPQLRTMGEYTNSKGVLERQPGMTARPLAEIEPSTIVNSKGKETRGGPQIGEASSEALKFTEFLRSVVNAQEAGAAHKFTPANSSSKPFEKTGLRVEGAADQLDAAKKALEAQGLNAVNVGDALHVGLFPDQNGKLMLGGQEADGRHVQAAVQKAMGANPQLANGLKTTAGRFESFYEPVPWGGEGDVTNELISRLQSAPLHNYAQRYDASKLPGLLGPQTAIDREFSATHGFEENPRVYKLRGLLADPKVGLSGLPAYVKKYGTAGLPAIAMSPFLPGLLSSDPSQQTAEYPVPAF